MLFLWISFLCTVATCLLLVILLILVFVTYGYCCITLKLSDSDPQRLLFHQSFCPIIFVWVVPCAWCDWPWLPCVSWCSTKFIGGINLHGTVCSETSYVMMKHLWLFEECQSFFQGTNMHITTLMYCNILEHLGRGLWFLLPSLQLLMAARVGCTHKTVKLRSL